LAATAALALTPAAYAANTPQPAPIYEKVGNWEVRVDPTVGQAACFIQGSWSPGILVRAGLITNDKAYVALYSPQWASLKPGQTYPLQLSFNNTAPETHTAIAKTFTSGATFLVVNFSQAEIFWADLAAATAFHIAYQGQHVLDGNLPGSGAAIAAMRRCQVAYAPSSDPFAKPAMPVTPVAPAKPIDPFKAI
jgi:hypothetical protein